MYDKPYFILQRLKLRLLREEKRSRSAPLTEVALRLVTELWQLEDSSRFIQGEIPTPEVPWSFKGG
jgi:hypothetical protein